MTPKLRFPEFTDVWQVRKLGDITEINPRVGSLPDDFVYIDLDSVKRGTLLKQNRISKIGSPSRAQRLLSRDDIIYQTVRPYQKNNFYFDKAGDYVASTGYAQIRARDGYYPRFVYTLLHTSTFVNKVLVRSTGTNYPAINSNDLAKVKVHTPSKPEQEKIADFLTAVDERIAVGEKKLELLETYKRGVMQKIFSQQIRFRDENGNNYPEWEEKKIEDLYLFIWTNSLSRENLAEQGGYKNVHYGDIHTKFSNTLDTTKEKIPYINRAPKMLIERYIPLSILKTRDIVMADASEDYADIGKATEIVKTEGSTVAGLHTFVLRPYEKIALGFGAYLFSSDDLRREIRKIATGASVLGISKSNLSQLTISLPSIKEQQKIATLLTTLDDKITAEKSKLTAAKQFKKALLQRMFI